MPIAQFPTPDINSANPKPLKYLKHKQSWDEIAISTRYEDGGMDFNLSTTTPPQEWTLEYAGMSEAEAKILDDHFDLAQGFVQTFDFREPRNIPWTGPGALQTGVQYLEYERDFDKFYFRQTRRIRLLKRP